MFKSKKEYDLAMQEILVRVRDEQSIDDLLKNADYFDAFVECVRFFYIKGVTFWNDADGNANIEKFNPQITRSGLNFIEYLF